MVSGDMRPTARRARLDLEQTAHLQRFDVIAHGDRLDDKAAVGLTDD